jgi:hypothetical protein
VPPPTRRWHRRHGPPARRQVHHGADPALAAPYPDALAQHTEVAPYFLDQREVTAVAAKAALG